MIFSHLREHFVFRPRLFPIFMDSLYDWHKRGPGPTEVEVSEAIWNALRDEGKDLITVGGEAQKPGQVMMLFGVRIVKEQK